MHERGCHRGLSKQIIELLIIAYQTIDDEQVSEAELQHISVFFSRNIS